METLVATVLIIVVFMIASMTLNNLFANSIKNSTGDIDAYLNELEYLYQNEKLVLPYYDTIGAWNISIVASKDKQNSTVLINAIHKNTNKTIETEIVEN
mgnify:CR=1 FL=1